MIAHPSFKLPTDKRAQLIGVAREEFAARGFGQASLNRIIGEVGMSKSSFYHFFENKTDLFQQTLEQSLAPFLGILNALDLSVLNAENFWPTMQMMADGMAEAINQNPEFILVGRMFYRSRDNAAELGLTDDLLLVSGAWIERILQHGQALGLLRDDVPNSFLMDGVMALGMAIDRWMLSHWDDIAGAERKILQHQAFDMFVRLLEKR